MKKQFLSALLCVLCASSYFIFTAAFSAAPFSSVRAAAAEDDTSYACALAHDIYLYAEKNEQSGLFCIPYTYYVKVLSEEGDYCYVQYSEDAAPYTAIYGYCRTEQLHFVDFVPERPFLFYPIEVTYTLSAGGTFPAGDNVFSEVTLTYAYYGEYTVGSSLYWYVALDGERGYLPKTHDISYDLNTDFEGTMPEEEGGNEPSPVNIPVAQIVLGAVLGVLALGVTYYLVRPRRPAPPKAESEFDI